ncbi:MAG: glycosyltransferase family 4 protein [Anaerolineae bacterium]
MRLFIASGIFAPESGGPATYLKHFLPEVIARGHQVTVLTFGDGPADEYPYPVTRIPRRFYPLRQWDYYRAASRLWPGHDLVYIHSLSVPLSPVIAPRIAKIVGDPAWERAMNRGWIAPDTDIDDFQSGLYSPFAELNKINRARLARSCDHIIVPSAYLKRMVVNWGVDPLKVSVIYNALRVHGRIPAVDQAGARRMLGLPDGPLLFTAARLTPWKGIDHSLRALARLDGIRLVIAGDGVIRPSLEALAASLGLRDRVMFLGSISRDDILLYFRAADYTLLYSGYEGLSHVLLESLYVGTPVLASDKGGNPEVVHHGVNGLLIPYIDIDAMVYMIAHAFEPGQRERLAANTGAGLERFEWSNLVDQTLQILESFV